jgi:trans-resveratrol di-O-methyltransferase
VEFDIRSQSLRCALDLGIPDAIDNNGQPMTLSELHTVLALPPSKKSHLSRLLRTLTHFGFFTEKSTVGASTQVVYDLTAQSRLVTQKNESTNMLAFVRCVVNDKWLKPSQYMADWFMQDDNQIPAELAHG